MQYLDVIQSGLDYIEANLKTTISAEELSLAAGFSVFHYYRLFQSITGMPVMQYILRRRLRWAIYEIAEGKTQIEAALAYGFDTSAGFYKAFRREFGCSPSSYLRQYNIRKPYRIDLLKEKYLMITKKRIQVMLKNWNMEDEQIQNVVYPSGAVSDNTFMVGENYYIKAYTLPGKAQNNVEILSALKNAGLSSGTWIPTGTGDCFASDGEFSFVLTQKLVGQPLSVDKLFQATDNSLAHYLGQIIGQLHLVLQSNDQILCNERNIFEEVRDQWLEPAKAVMNLSEDFCREYLTVFADLHQSLPVQIIHRDPNPNNILLKDGVLSGFIDFELSQRSIRLFDPCYAATGILVESGALDESDSGKAQKWLEIFQHIIRGYDDVIHLTESEKQALPYVVFSIQLICVGYFCSSEKFRELSESNIKILRWLLEHRKELEFED